MNIGKQLPKSGGFLEVTLSFVFECFSQPISKSNFYCGFDTTVAIAKSTE
ncbi:hypothetical protein T07_4137 [Trichinella nelsoni]|uniref:Uncharacterized protein n=1 Tax=Trichinella nelsoni TaxID=6336 RepID=A0A0V0RC11_9BILA|nr:hypothetical protein T07_4137 [Trichinella nelsoni]